MKEERCIHVSGGKRRWKETLRKPWSRWKDNIKWVVKKFFGMDWTAFIWLKTRTRGWKSSSSINCRNSLSQMRN
jgi:hypothetical protein